MIARRALGRSGLEVSILGFGVSGPHATRFAPAAETEGLVLAALPLGITLFDTAPFYGEGEAERRLGAALTGVPRDQYAVMTKTGTVRRGGRWAKNFEPGHIRAELDASLDRLGTSHVDVLLLHGPGLEALTDRLLATMEELKAEGLARAVGVCGRGPELDAAIDAEAFDVLMAPVRIDMGVDAKARIALARAGGMGVIGFEALSPAQPRLRAVQTAADAWYAARGVLRGRRAGGPVESPRACLQWALREGKADAVVTSTTRLQHMFDNVDAAMSLDAPVPAP